MVHLKVYVIPGVPLNALVGLFGEVMVPPEPEVIVQVPVPVEGVLPASAVVVSPHIDAPNWSEPASAVVGARWKVMVTSSVEVPHGGLLMVQRKM